jgi:hypothetical protein
MDWNGKGRTSNGISGTEVYGNEIDELNLSL